MPMVTLPEPVCPLGYPKEQLLEILGNRYAYFMGWMNGQTMSICEGRAYDYTINEYKPDACVGNTHGVVVYQWDLRRFLEGLPIED